MAFAGKATLLLCLLLLTPLLSVESISGDGIHCVYSLKKNGFRTGSRKMLALDAVLDYDYAVPNPKHDPRKGRPPGGRNP